MTTFDTIPRSPFPRAPTLSPPSIAFAVHAVTLTLSHAPRHHTLSPRRGILRRKRSAIAPAHTHMNAPASADTRACPARRWVAGSPAPVPTPARPLQPRGAAPPDVGDAISRGPPPFCPSNSLVPLTAAVIAPLASSRQLNSSSIVSAPSAAAAPSSPSCSLVDAPPTPPSPPPAHYSAATDPYTPQLFRPVALARSGSYPWGFPALAPMAMSMWASPFAYPAAPPAASPYFSPPAALPALPTPGSPGAAGTPAWPPPQPLPQHVVQVAPWLALDPWRPSAPATHWDVTHPPASATRLSRGVRAALSSTFAQPATAPPCAKLEIALDGGGGLVGRLYGTLTVGADDGPDLTVGAVLDALYAFLQRRMTHEEVNDVKALGDEQYRALVDAMVRRCASALALPQYEWTCGLRRADCLGEGRVFWGLQVAPHVDGSWKLNLLLGALPKS